MAKGRKTGGRVPGSVNKPKIVAQAARNTASTVVDAEVATARGGGRRSPAFEAGSQARARARRTARHDPQFGLRIRYEDLDELRDNDRNSNRHSAEDILVMERSLVEFGWTTPMAKAKGVLIYGHLRRTAARNLRDRGVAIPNNPDPDKGPIVDLSHLTPAQRRAYLIADNEIARRAKTDDDILKLELGELRDIGFDVTLTGFGADDIEAMFAEPKPPEPPPVRDTVEHITCPKCQHRFRASG